MTNIIQNDGIVQRLVEFEKDVIEHYEQIFEDNESFSKVRVQEEYNISDIFTPLCKVIKNNFEFDEEDLTKVVLELAKNRNNIKDVYEYSSLSGIYSGALLRVLRERNLEKGKETNIEIDLNNERFDYLFAFSQADNLIIKNVRGNNILTYFGFDTLGIFDLPDICIENKEKLSVKSVKVMNIKGNNNFSYLGHLGKMDEFTAIGIEGNKNFLDIADSGMIETMYLFDIKKSRDKSKKKESVYDFGKIDGTINNIYGFDVESSCFWAETMLYANSICFFTMPKEEEFFGSIDHGIYTRHFRAPYKFAENVDGNLGRKFDNKNVAWIKNPTGYQSSESEIDRNIRKIGLTYDLVKGTDYTRLIECERTIDLIKAATKI